jgi:hypothetical protein
MGPNRVPDTYPAIHELPNTPFFFSFKLHIYVQYCTVIALHTIYFTIGVTERTVTKNSTTTTFIDKDSNRDSDVLKKKTGTGLGRFKEKAPDPDPDKNLPYLLHWQL